MEIDFVSIYSMAYEYQCFWLLYIVVVIRQNSFSHQSPLENPHLNILPSK